MINMQFFAKWRQLGMSVILLTTSGLLANTVSAQGNASAGEGKITVCLACHGTSGNNSTLPDVPKIGGQNEKYLLKQMHEIKDGTRAAPLMTGMLAALNDQDLADIAAWYSSQPAPQGAAEAEKVALGETIYKAGISDIGVAACAACHSPTGLGNESAGYPALSGQDVAYTVAQLKAFRGGVRQNDDAEVMRSIASRLSDNEIDALASYVSGLR
jgi:cytochrome c553